MYSREQNGSWTEVEAGRMGIPERQVSIMDSKIFLKRKGLYIHGNDN